MRHKPHTKKSLGHHTAAKRAGLLHLDGDLITTLREEKFLLSREDFCLAYEVSPKTMRNIETDPSYGVTFDTVKHLANVFKVDPQNLLRKNIPPPVLLTSHKEILRINIEIVATAETIFCATGSRSRDAEYLRTIEKTLEEKEHLVHYRVMFRPPFKDEFQTHLLNLLNLRDPNDRKLGYQTLGIAIYRDLLKYPEAFLCLNERKGLIVCPSCSAPQGYDTAVVLEHPHAIKGWRRWIGEMYTYGEKVETADGINTLGLQPLDFSYV